MGKGKKKRRVGCSVSAAATIRRRRLIGVECASARARRQLGMLTGWHAGHPWGKVLGTAVIPRREVAAFGRGDGVDR
jgi:hypothetical protein